MRVAFSRRRSGVANTVAALAVVVVTAGCGKVGPPLPPEPRGPMPPLRVMSRQIGDRVLVSLEVPSPRGSKPARQPVVVQVVRVDYRPSAEPVVDPDAFRRRGTLVAELRGDPLEPGRRLDLPDSTVGPGEPGVVGWTLRYGVRVMDRRGRSSPLVVAEDLVPIEPPAPPSALAAEATSDGVRLSWRGPAPGEASFNVYRTLPGESFPPAPLNASPLGTTEYLDSDARVGETYVYEVRTAGTSAPPFRESRPSAPVRVLAEDRLAPATPDGLVVVQEGNALRMLWNPNGERDLAGYRIYRSVDGGPWSPLGAETVTQPLYLDADVEPGTRVAYRVTAVDRSDPPNESDPSVVVEVDVADDPGAPGGGPR